MDEGTAMTTIAVGDKIKVPGYPWVCEVAAIGKFLKGRTQEEILVARIKPITNLDLKYSARELNQLTPTDSEEVTDATLYPGHVFSWTNHYRRSKPPEGWSVYDPEYPKKDSNK